VFKFPSCQSSPLQPSTERPVQLPSEAELATVAVAPRTVKSLSGADSLLAQQLADLVSKLRPEESSSPPLVVALHALSPSSSNLATSNLALSTVPSPDGPNGDHAQEAAVVANNRESVPLSRRINSVDVHAHRPCKLRAVEPSAAQLLAV